MGGVFAYGTSVTTLRLRIRALARQLEVPMLIIDEIHSLLAGTFREQCLLLTLGLMAIGTVSIACTPSSSSIGLIAPLLVVDGRLIQGLSAECKWGRLRLSFRGCSLEIKASTRVGRRRASRWR
jgi:hypothetical protein